MDEKLNNQESIDRLIAELREKNKELQKELSELKNTTPEEEETTAKVQKKTS